MSSHFYLIRHGQKVGVYGDPALTELGQQQAERTGQYLKDFAIDAIQASPLKRTQETAHAIAQHLKLQVHLNPLLVERENWDDANQSFNEFAQEWIKSTNDREFVLPSGDSSRSAGQRLETAMLTASENGHHQVVFVSHGGVIADVLRNLFHDEVMAPHLAQAAYGWDYEIGLCSITQIVLTDGKFELLSVAKTAHLL